MKTPDELTSVFRARGLKVTPQRQAVFAALYGNPSHPTAEAIHETVSAAMPTISLRTVYQTLNDLAEMGEIGHVDLGIGAARFDPNLEPHHHVVCTSCGVVRDVDGGVASVTVTDHVAEDFAVASTDIVFRGLCAACAAAAPTPVGAT